MKSRLIILITITFGIAITFTWINFSQGLAKSPPSNSQKIKLDQEIPPAPSIRAQLPITENQKTILIWPKSIQTLSTESLHPETWLDTPQNSALSVRNNLLISVQAIVALIPDLTVETDEPYSELISVTGNSGYLINFLDRLGNHPLVAQVTDDSVRQREIARTAWQSRVKEENSQFQIQENMIPPAPINIRHQYISNVVWGISEPYNEVRITHQRTSISSMTISTSADEQGLYFAFFPWEIRSNDVIRYQDNSRSKEITVPGLKVSTNPETNSIKGEFSDTEVDELSFRNLNITVGNQTQSGNLVSPTSFWTQFSPEVILPGTHGFITYGTDRDVQIYQPFSVGVVNVRRDTSNGLSINAAHMDGLSSIVWGAASPEATLVLTLTRPGDFRLTRTVLTDQAGNFRVSMDQIIEGGDFLQIRDGTDLKTLDIPLISFEVDPVAKIINGIAPANVSSLTPGAAHTLQISIPGPNQQVTTTHMGEFTADFSSASYLAGLLGSIRYTSHQGDNIFQPMFIADPPARGEIDDWRADIILGQPDFTQITPNQVVSNQVFIPEGALIDRSVQPNRLFVYDSGNSRVLGFSHLGVCSAGVNANQNCTANSDCPESYCQINEEKGADLVIGQPNINSSTCNGDSSYQTYPDVPMATSITLCGLREEQMSISEGGSGATMVTDQNGNLYIPDFFNNRVLRYDDPFNTDTAADYVWGQFDFSGITCNHGAGIVGPTDSRSLCLAPPPGIGDLRAGVALDSDGNLWVADNENNRVLRFPNDTTTGLPAKEADLVLGQPDFTTNRGGSGENGMFKPASIAIDPSNTVYVADSLNNRVLLFYPPFSNGMTASLVISAQNMIPTGLAIDLNGALWVNEEGNRRITRYQNQVLDLEISVGYSLGGLGVDEDGNLYATDSGTVQEVSRYSLPSYLRTGTILKEQEDGIFNFPGPRGFWDVSGIEIAGGQLIASDGSRIVFWNNPWEITNFQSADGFIGVPDFHYHEKWGPRFRSMRADDQGRLWVTHTDGGQESQLYKYKLPLETSAEPIQIINSPLPLQGGGVFTWTQRGILLSGIAIQPDCDCLWLSDADNNRVFRIQNANTNPVVDIVLGQTDINGIHCNQGRDVDENYARAQYPTQDSLCHPGGIAFDNNGNFFVSDHNAESAGNWRLLEWDNNLLPNHPSIAVFGIPATRVFGRNNDFTEPDCLLKEEDPICGPFEPTFDSQGRMMIGFNSYIGTRFPAIYQDILTNPHPIGVIGEIHSWPVASRFDQFDNLYIVDSNRNRILIYKTNHVRTFDVTGEIRDSARNAVSGVTINVENYLSNATSDSSGIYTITDLVTDTYIITPDKPSCSFSPPNLTPNVPLDIIGQDFLANCFLPVNFDPGWKLISLPIAPYSSYQAQSLLDDINSQGGNCTEVNRWLNGGWDPHISGLPFNNYDIDLGVGYFIRCDSSSGWNYQGENLVEVVSISLQPSWNLISVPYPLVTYTAQSLLDDINSQGGNCTEVNRWLNGGWDPYVYGLPFNDFSIDANQGYFIHCSSASNFLPTE